MMPSKRSVLLGSGALVGLLSLVASCNLIINPDPVSCETNEDCVNFPNTGCDTEQGICVSLDTCSANSECSDTQVCRAVSPRACVEVLGGDCQELYPADDTFRNDNALLVGVTSPLTVETSTGLSIANGAKLAVDQFNAQGGIEGTKPIVLVLCDDHAESVDAAENGKHIAAIGAQALIGPAYSGQTIMTAGTDEEPGTVQNNVLLISPSATSPLVTGIQDESPRCKTACGDDAGCADACPGLVWRTSPSDDYQGAALSKYFEELEPAVKKRGGESRSTIKVYVLYKPDAYGQLISEVIRTTLRFNNAPATQQQGGNFFRTDYTDIDEEVDGIQPDFTIIDDVIAGGPDAIFLMGTGEVAEIIDYIEGHWSGSDSDRPFYITGDGGLSSDVTNKARELGVEDRIRGSVPGPVASSIYDAFSGDYNTRFPGSDTVDGPEIFGAAGAYDIIYMLAYSVIAARGKPITAEQLATGFASLAAVGETQYEAGQSDLGNATSTLQDGGAIDFEGASGHLDFDIATGEAPSAIQIWCIPPPSVAGVGVNSGVFWDNDEIGGSEEPAALDPPQFSCPFNSCMVAADCATHPYGHDCVDGFCGCNADTPDCLDPTPNCNLTTNRCEP